jgi:putative tryptophan/tyrosine transport system substrate-binding protein
MRLAEGRAERLAEMAADLVRRRVDLILTAQTPAAEAARQATRDIPIVMGGVGDPVATGLVASLARPGGNITGIATLTPETGTKLLDLIRDIRQSSSRVAVLANAADPFTKPFLEQLGTSARNARIEMRVFEVRAGEDWSSAFRDIAAGGVDALIVQPSLPLKPAADLALAHRLPSFSPTPAYTEFGGLLSYSGSIKERGPKIAYYVDRILKGARPADLPVQQPTLFELRVNLKTARALGIAIPDIVMFRADEVIE